MSLANIDDLLIKVQHNEPVVPVVQEKMPEPEPELAESDENHSEPEERLTHLEKFRKDKEEYLSKQAQETENGDESATNRQQIDDESAIDSQDTDDYGNEVPKSKMYSEEEVQAMIRKRLKLHHEEKQQVQQPQQQYQTDQVGDEQPWEVQLENHIEQTVQKLEAKKQEVAWQAEQQRVQAEFEHKFSTGMAKYPDFAEVVSGKPITNGIMMAARSMADPAAFIYAAAKQQPKELERISAINDPYVLAAEVGRLEERMKKARTVSKAPKPPTKTKGDMPDKGMTRASLDDLIRHDAKRKLGRR